jgi:hypothetical protein
MIDSSTDAQDLNKLAVRIGLPEFSVSPEREDDLEAALALRDRAHRGRAHYCLGPWAGAPARERMDTQPLHPAGQTTGAGSRGLVGLLTPCESSDSRANLRQ